MNELRHSSNPWPLPWPCMSTNEDVLVKSRCKLICLEKKISFNPSTSSIIRYDLCSSILLSAGFMLSSNWGAIPSIFWSAFQSSMVKIGSWYSKRPFRSKAQKKSLPYLFVVQIARISQSELSQISGYHAPQKRWSPWQLRSLVIRWYQILRGLQLVRSSDQGHVLICAHGMCAKSSDLTFL